MSEQTEIEGINLLEGIPSQPDFVDALDGPKLDNVWRSSFLSFPSSPQKPAAYTTGNPNTNPIATSTAYQPTYQQQLEQMNKQFQSQKKATADDTYTDIPTQSYQQTNQQSYQSQQYQQTQPSYTQPQPPQTSYSPLAQLQAQTYSTSQSQIQPQSSYIQNSQTTPTSTYSQLQQLQNQTTSYIQPSTQSYTQNSYSQPQTNTYPSSSSYSTQQPTYVGTQTQQTLQTLQNSLNSSQYPSTSTSAYTQPQQTNYVSTSSSSYTQPQSTYQNQQSTYSDSNMSTPRSLSTSQSFNNNNNNNNNQGYATQNNNNNNNNSSNSNANSYLYSSNNGSANSSGSNSQLYPSSTNASSNASSYASYQSNQYPTAAQLLAQNGGYVSTSQNFISKDGMKLPINMNQSRPRDQYSSLAPRGNKGGLLQRVLGDDMRQGHSQRYIAPNPSPTETAFWLQQQEMGQMAGNSYNLSTMYNNSTMYQNIPGNYSTHTRSTKPLIPNNVRMNNNNNRRAPTGALYRRPDRNRYDRNARDSYVVDSEDDDFVDNRDLNELSENSRSDSFSEDNEVARESSITTRKRRRESGTELLEEGSDSSIHIIESDFGEESLRPVTRSRVGGSERKQTRHTMHYNSDDSDIEEEDDGSVQNTEEDAESISDDLDEEGEEGSGTDKKERISNRNKVEEGGEGKISQLQKLITVCEAKVDKLSAILAENGLEYEKLKQTAVSITLPLAISQPTLLSDHCKLTQYQLVGLNWLWLLNQANLNGILADEMGLGKTLQTIAMFALLKEKNLCQGPHLVVVPSSTLTQWYNEIQHWCPTLKTVTYYGNLTERKEIRSQCKNYEEFDILLTTYQLVGGKSDKKLFKNIPWHYLVLDEAQNIKNGSSLRFQTLFKIKAKNKLLLTGTPLQNNLQELWALLHFLMSDEFEKLKIENYTEVFRDFIKNNNEGTKQKKRMKVTEQDAYISKLKKILEPFLLRRLKREVSLDLSAKIHNKEVVTMTETQQSLYTQIYMHSKSVWNEKQHQKQMSRGIVKDGNKSLSLHNFLNNLLMQLRKVSNHPLLLRVYYDDLMIQQIAQVLLSHDSAYKRDKLDDIIAELAMYSDWELHEMCTNKKETISQLVPFVLADTQVFNISGKMNKLKEILIQLKKENHRVLIFSQMTRMMNILSCMFDREQHTYVRLDGSTPVADRQVLIDKYNNDPKIFIFLLSTRAGGLGINLSTADTVIFYDIAFNPQVDRQAEDRCHRLGQKKQVNVITLLTKDSCEEQIWEMAHEKKELNDIMLQEGEYSKKFQDEDGDYEIIEEKEEELGTDAAVQVFLTQIFSNGEEGGEIQAEDEQEEKKERKKTATATTREKKEKIEKETNSPKQEKVVRERAVKEKPQKEPKPPKEPKPKKEKVVKPVKEKKVKVPNTPRTPREKKPPKSPKSTKSPTEPTRKSGRAKNTPTKAEPDSVPEDVVLEGNLKRSESHLFETIADQPKLKKRKYSSTSTATSSLLYDSHATTKRSPGRPSRASIQQNPRAKKGDDDFVFSIEDDEEDDEK
jgi:SWI/SNF-related matrix-associated actin-dependent regulator 1 of chromatin subfamily A